MREMAFSVLFPNPGLYLIQCGLSLCLVHTHTHTQRSAIDHMDHGQFVPANLLRVGPTHWPNPLRHADYIILDSDHGFKATFQIRTNPYGYN